MLLSVVYVVFFCVFKQKTAYEMRISDWSSDVCSSDLRHLNAQFGDELVDHRTWVLAGDGCLMEGVNHEAIGLAGHLNLGRLIVLWDDNKITIDGAVDLSSSEDVRARYGATGRTEERRLGKEGGQTV